MKETLRKLGISEETICEMTEICPEIKELSEDDISKKINMLKDLNCDDSQIMDIISSNPFYLDSINTDVEKLVNKLEELGFTEIDSLLEGNPYILNLDDFEIEEYIQKRDSAYGRRTYGSPASDAA